MRFRQAQKKEADGNIVWVEYGKTWRTATLADLPGIMERRAEQAKLRAPIAMAEIPGIRVEGITQDFNLVRVANQYAAQAVN